MYVKCFALVFFFKKGDGGKGFGMITLLYNKLAKNWSLRSVCEGQGKRLHLFFYPLFIKEEALHKASTK